MFKEEKKEGPRLVKQGTGGIKKGKDDDGDDPIAQAMALRMKAGGPTSVITPAEAKKLGLLKTTTTAVMAAEKLKAGVDKSKPAGQKEEKKTPANKEN